jgi:hypothetical protein
MHTSLDGFVKVFSENLKENINKLKYEIKLS